MDEMTLEKRTDNNPPVTTGMGIPEKIASPTTDTAKLMEMLDQAYDGNVAGAPKVEAKQEPKVQLEPEVKPVVPAGLEQFKKEDGSLDAEKIQKSTQHLEQGIANAEESIKRYKELQAKFTQTTQQAKQVKVEAETKASPDVSRETIEEFSPEFKKKLLEDLEKDPATTLLNLTIAASRREADRMFREEHARQSSEHNQKSQLDWIEQQKSTGNDWILQKEWVDRIEKVLEERPYLKASSNPFADAILYLNDAPKSNGQKPVVAPPGPKTPILGVSGSIPPANFYGPVSTSGDLDKAKADLMNTLGDRKAWLVAQKEMDKKVSDLLNKYAGQ